MALLVRAPGHLKAPIIQEPIYSLLFVHNNALNTRQRFFVWKSFGSDHIATEKRHFDLTRWVVFIQRWLHISNSDLPFSNWTIY